MIYMTCEELKSRLNAKFGCDCTSKIYLNGDSSIFGAVVGDIFLETCDLMEKTGMRLDYIRIINMNNYNLTLWKEVTKWKIGH